MIEFKGLPAPTLGRSVPISELPGLLANIVAIVEPPKEENEIPGWYLMGAFQVETRKLQLEGVNDRDSAETKMPLISESNAEELIKLATDNPDAFDLSCYIAGLQIHALSGHPEASSEIKLFGTRVLCGKISRPRRAGRPKGRDAYLRVWQYAVCRWVEAASDLKLSRSKESKNSHVSACDLVADAFSNAGWGVTYSQLLDLCNKKNFEEVRYISERVFPTPIARKV